MNTLPARVAATRRLHRRLTATIRRSVIAGLAIMVVVATTFPHLPGRPWLHILASTAVVTVIPTLCRRTAAHLIRRWHAEDEAADHHIAQSNVTWEPGR